MKTFVLMTKLAPEVSRKVADRAELSWEEHGWTRCARSARR